MSEYNHKEVEGKWQKKWEEDQIFKVENKVEGKENEFVLVEFPYPSGDLHMGHWYAFSGTDIYARYRRAIGKNVLFPIGFDAFGLPAENAAIKRGLDPKEWTYSNMDTMRTQMKAMGNIFDWDREIASCSPEYYKWTQWIFTQMFEKGLAYKKKAVVNWDPVDNTILANEQVLPDGTADRSGAVVEKKEMDQWFIKITDYADRLVDGLDDLNWPEEIKNQQRNWIGRSHGSEITFKVKDTDFNINVFTTRADTLFGATYVVLAPENELVTDLKDKIGNWDEVESYIEETKAKKEIDRGREKTGVKLDGVFAINSANQEEIPVYIADYVLNSYGTGAVMAVPSHDERDYEFAKKFGLEIRDVISQHRIDGGNPPQDGKEVVERRTVHALVKNPKNGKYLFLDWKKQPWLNFVVGGVDEGEDIIEAAKREVLEETGYKNLKFIKTLNSAHVTSEYFASHKDENRRAYTTAVLFELENEDRDEVSLEEKDKHEAVWKTLEDFCKHDKFVCAEYDIWLKGLEGLCDCHTEKGFLINSGEFDGLTSDEAKVKITEFVGGEIKTTFKLRDWSVGRQRYWGCPAPIVYDPEGNAHAVPKEHLPWILPEDVDCTPTGVAPLAKSEELKKRTEEIFGEGWTPEVETLDTFLDSSWYFLRYLDPKNEDELVGDVVKDWMPVSFYSGGAEHTTLHLLYSRFFNKFLFDIGVSPVDEPYKERLNRSLILGPGGVKMSKSKPETVVNPDEIVERLGADTVRAYLAFMGPYNEAGAYPWDPNGVVGIRRFLEKVWRISENVSEESSDVVKKELHKVIKRVGEEVSQLKFNAAIAQLMSFMNLVDKEGIGKEDMKDFIKLLSPVTPYISEEIWSKLGGEGYVSNAKWPVFDPELVKDDVVSVAIQINGKVRGKIDVPVDIDESEIYGKVVELDEIQKWIEDKEIKKTIYIKGKIFSIVIG